MYGPHGLTFRKAVDETGAYSCVRVTNTMTSWGVAYVYRFQIYFQTNILKIILEFVLHNDLIILRANIYFCTTS